MVPFKPIPAECDCFENLAVCALGTDHLLQGDLGTYFQNIWTFIEPQAVQNPTDATALAAEDQNIRSFYDQCR